MNTQKLLVHDRRQRQAVKRIHACIIHLLRVLYLTCNMRLPRTGEGISHLPTLAQHKLVAPICNRTL